MKKFVKNTLSCALAMLCTANAVPFASVAAADPAALNMASAFVASASEDGFTANDYSAERGTVTKHVEFKINTAEISADAWSAGRRSGPARAYGPFRPC